MSTKKDKEIKKQQAIIRAHNDARKLAKLKASKKAGRARAG